jgi:hypothetical protein
MADVRTVGGCLLALGLLLPGAAAPDGAAVTAAFSPADPVVGVTKVTIVGKASAGGRVIDTSTFPDGTVHIFANAADAAGAYKDGPFVLQQLGTYRDVLRDSATGASTMISYSGAGDFRVAVDPPGTTITTGGHARFEVTFTSVDGFGGEVVPQFVESSAPPDAVLTWSQPRLRIQPHGAPSIVLTVQTLVTTPPGTYRLALQGTSGSVSHAPEPAVVLTVNPPPPGTITAALSPAGPIVGVTEARIGGRATAGQRVIDTSTFPDGVTHQFVVDVTGAGTYSEGPFVLQELGTYHDVLEDGATGAKTEISYRGVGDFSTAVAPAGQTVARGDEAKFAVTFKSLSGFAGAITPAVPDLALVPGATASWSSKKLMVRSGDTIAVGLTIKTTSETRLGTYKLAVQGSNGSVTHAAPAVMELTVK